MYRFAQKVCLVSGATSGIGRATALRLGQESATVVCLGREVKAGHEIEAASKAAGHCSLKQMWAKTPTSCTPSIRR